MEESNVVVVKRNNPYLVPGSILISGAFIAAAIFFSGGNIFNDKEVVEPVQLQTANTDLVRAVTEIDHIKGNPSAAIKIVEYSDFECPFCKVLHDTLNAVIEKNGPNGDVAWVFRQLPLEGLHPVKARAVAVASECAAEQGGNDGFWNFADRYFELTLTNNRTDIETVIPAIAAEIGLDAANFSACLSSGKHDAKIDADIANAVETGGNGTPWTIVIAPNGKTFPINGAQPQAAIEQIINIARQQK